MGETLLGFLSNEVSIHPTWQDISIRLLLTMLAGAVVGLDRETSGHAAGFRTNVLVGLAACTAMIQANLLLSTVGKAGDSFVNIDVMRLPLGILTGVGFIGGGAIFKRGDLVTGVTTAATLWMMTVIGLAFGGGQIALGTMTTVLSFVTLWLLKRVDAYISRERRAILSIALRDGEAPPDLDRKIAPMGYQSRFVKKVSGLDGNNTVISYEIRWRRSEKSGPPADLLQAIESSHRVATFDTNKEATV